MLTTVLRKGRKMMPLTLAEVGEVNIIRKIGGRPEVRTHLENLGFVAGGAVTVINTIGGNVIVSAPAVAFPESWHPALLKTSVTVV